jgi:hypothetical protein
MAVTIIGGLSFATLLTLIVVPVLHATFYRIPARTTETPPAPRRQRSAARSRRMRPHMKPELEVQLPGAMGGLVLALLCPQASHAQTLPRPEPEGAWVPLVQVHVLGQEEELLEIPGRTQAASAPTSLSRFRGC